MNRMMMLTRGIDTRLLDDAPGAGGTPPANAETPPANAETPPANTETPPANAETPPANAETPPASTPPAEPKPFLGEQKPPAPPSEEDYTKALVKDEALLGDDKRITLDADLYKACVPVMQKYGVTPEAANALANALAKAQVDDAKARMQARIDYFEKMKAESLRTYTPADFEAINAGIDRWFKPGGVMNSVIRNSELGADPEFLALMHHLGKAAKEDGGAGAAGGSGGSDVDPNTTQGLSDLW